MRDSGKSHTYLYSCKRYRSATNENLLDNLITADGRVITVVDAVIDGVNKHFAFYQSSGTSNNIAFKKIFFPFYGIRDDGIRNDQKLLKGDLNAERPWKTALINNTAWNVHNDYRAIRDRVLKRFLRQFIYEEQLKISLGLLMQTLDVPDDHSKLFEVLLNIYAGSHSRTQPRIRSFTLLEGKLTEQARRRKYLKELLPFEKRVQLSNEDVVKQISELDKMLDLNHGEPKIEYEEVNEWLKQKGVDLDIEPQP